MTMNSENVLMVFGPPGTGKTTYLERQVKLAADSAGKENIMVASFTRAAAAEIGGRDIQLPKGAVNTLHAHCYAAVGRGDITETMIDDWNKFAPMYQISTNAKVGEFEDNALEGKFQAAGDEYLSRMNLYRAKMIHPKMWPTNIQAFAAKWKEFKSETESLDFTDLIEWCLYTVDTAPNNPRIGFFDEAQDFTPLELAVVRKWGSAMDKVIMCGDDDQVLYGFKGASAEAFLGQDVPEANKRVLSQSYRVPRAVLELADRYIKQIKNREPKVYKPRDYDGDVRRISAGNFKSPESVLKDAQERYLSEGKSVMFLVSCSYMLEPLKSALREQGLPFHNPYRRKRGDWNPLVPSRGTSAADRLLSFLRPDNAVHGDGAMMWTADDLAVWTNHIKAKGIFKRGGKIALEQMMGMDEVPITELFRFFEEQAIVELLDLPDTEARVRWFLDSTLETKVKPFQYPSKVLLTHGVKAMTERPQIIIGSIHSVKGGQADAVYLFPDLSLAGMKEYTNPKNKDGIIRQFYVGMTRARESLIIVPPATGYKAIF